MDLIRIVDEVAELLPQQGPISIFVHHNPLHAFEHLPFEEAVVVAGARLGCEPFLSGARYRAELRQGRILCADVEAVLHAELGAAASDIVVSGLTRFDVQRALAMHGVPEVAPSSLDWILTETSALTRYRDDVTAPRGADEVSAVPALWAACLDAASRQPRRPRTIDPPVRHRDAVLASRSVDTDAWIQPVLIRFVSAYLDQGMARRTMPRREAGMRSCFHELYATQAFGAWSDGLASIIDADGDLVDADASLAASLDALGVAPDDWLAYLSATALALRGWAGMVHQFETRPDRVPTVFVPARLADFLAVQLLLERAALGHVAAEIGVPLTELRERAATSAPQPEAPGDEATAWPLFHLAQLCGLDAAAIGQMTPTEFAALTAEFEQFDAIAQRRVLHIAYEQRLRDRYFDALLAAPPTTQRDAPAWQAIFCIDDREESIRRHLEEAEPEVETFGAAGFFGVVMYYHGVNEAHPRALCPVALKPRHYVAEVADDAHPVVATWRRAQQAGIGAASRTAFVGSRSLVVGALMSLAGVVAMIPLVLRVLVPRVGGRLEPRHLLAVRRTNLQLERSDTNPPIGQWSGFTVEEMADIVEGLLRDIGVADRLTPLVLVIGHGSSSLNNPQNSAYDCGACAGAHGGPNARAFATMANDARVRDVLLSRGWSLPAPLWFVGGERNTCTNSVTLFDLDDVPHELQTLVERARSALDVARETEAHERMRRFESVPTWLGPKLALRQAEARGVDLAQPRAEGGHATNAMAFVGRRSRTRHLFLDRRAFLVSYDPTADLDGAILAGMLRAVVPVMAGINLEYYFGYVDPTGYGCGTKLPHNIAAMLGVMDGMQSDLRTGLPWQMVELHEPVRLTMVVETPRETLARILAEDEQLAQLVRNRWIFVACLDPGDQALWVHRDGDFVPYEPQPVPEPVVGGSVDVYRGQRGHLPFSRMSR